MKIHKCKLCKKNDAIWALQYIASDEPSFYALGWHIRGFPVIKICDECLNKINDEYQAKIKAR